MLCAHACVSYRCCLHQGCGKFQATQKVNQIPNVPNWKTLREKYERHSYVLPELTPTLAYTKPSSEISVIECDWITSDWMSQPNIIFQSVVILMYYFCCGANLCDSSQWYHRIEISHSLRVYVNYISMELTGVSSLYSEDSPIQHRAVPLLNSSARCHSDPALSDYSLLSWELRPGHHNISQWDCSPSSWRKHHFWLECVKIAL